MYGGATDGRRRARDSATAEYGARAAPSLVGRRSGLRAGVEAGGRPLGSASVGRRAGTSARLRVALALRELEASACAAAAVLLALFHAAVAREQAVLAQDGVEA